MAIKTISLELDAYEKLRSAKRGGESFSAVVRRATFEEGVPSTVNEAAPGYPAVKPGRRKEPDYWDRVQEADRTRVALESFDAATARQQVRNSAWKRTAAATTKLTDRGWTRDSLYDETLPGQ